MSVRISKKDGKRAYFFRAMLYLIWNAVTFVICLMCNSMQSKFSDYKIGEVGDIYRSSLSPAGFAFSIWGIIYFGLCAFLCYHITTVVVLFRQRHHDIAKSNPNPQADRSLGVAFIIVDGIGIWFGVANLLNASWIPVFVQATDLSVGIAAIILISLVSSLIRIQLGVHHWWRKVVPLAPALQDTQQYQHQTNKPLPAVGDSVPPTPELGHQPEMSNDGNTPSQNDGGSNTGTHRNDESSILVPAWELFLVDLTFSIYLGWTTVAATLNTQMWFDHVLFKGNKVSLMIVLLALTIAFLIFAVFYVWRQKNFAAGLVFTWAATAIWVNTMKSGECDAAPNFDEQKCNVVGITALVFGCLIGGFSIFQLVRFILKVVAQVEKTSQAQ